MNRGWALLSSETGTVSGGSSTVTQFRLVRDQFLPPQRGGKNHLRCFFFFARRSELSPAKGQVPGSNQAGTWVSPLSGVTGSSQWLVTKRVLRTRVLHSQSVAQKPTFSRLLDPFASQNRPLVVLRSSGSTLGRGGRQSGA